MEVVQFKGYFTIFRLLNPEHKEYRTLPRRPMIKKPKEPYAFQSIDRFAWPIQFENTSDPFGKLALMQFIESDVIPGQRYCGVSIWAHANEVVISMTNNAIGIRLRTWD
jgi:hypothetical protein